MANQREASRKEWRVRDLSGSAAIEEINSGSLQRIADATEKMAASYDAMREDRDRYQRLYEQKRDEVSRLRFSIRSLRGVITKLRRGQS